MKRRSVIFLHGFPFNGSAWAPQVAAFGERFDVHAPDLRGHGTSPAQPGPWMISHYVKDLVNYMDDRGISKATICGLSMGGYIALQFAASYPERIEGLILCDTRADGDSNDVKLKRFELIERLHREGLQGFAKEFSATVLSETTRREQPELRYRVEQMILRNSKENVAMVVGALASRLDNRAALAGIECRTLILVGADDKVTPPELSELMAGGIEDSELQFIDKAGHLSNLENPAAFNRCLEEFFKCGFARTSQYVSPV